MDFNESNYRYSLDPAGLNATIRDTLVSSSSLKIHPFTGNEDVNEWIGDFEMLAYAAEWSDETKAKKFPMYLRGGAACWYRVKYPNDCEERTVWSGIKQAFFDHFAPTNYNVYINEKMSAEKQKYGESVISYVDRMTDLCSRITPRLGEKQKIEKILDGLDPRLKQLVNMFDFECVTELLNRAKKLKTALKAGSISVDYKEKKATVCTNVAKVHDDGLSKSDIEEVKSLLINSRRGPKMMRRQPKCYKCEKIGHVAADCRSKKQNTQNNESLQCRYCARRGHTEKDCYPKKKAMEL